MLRRKRRGIKPSARINQVTSITDADEKLKALEAARLQIEKQFGQGSLMKLGAKTESNGIDVIPSGSILLDEALGIGGYPRGRIIEIFGPESSGKTTLALHIGKIEPNAIFFTGLTKWKIKIFQQQKQLKTMSFIRSILTFKKR